jgi:hypothetical protein
LHQVRREVDMNALYGLLTLQSLLAIIGRGNQLCITMCQDYGRFTMKHFVKIIPRTRVSVDSRLIITETIAVKE